MTTQPNLNAIRDAAADLIADTMYTYDGVERGTVTDAAKALQDAGLLTARMDDPDVATLHIYVTDAGDRWSTVTGFHNTSPGELSDMVSAGAAQVITDAVEGVVKADPDATTEDQAALVMRMLKHIVTSMVPQTLDGLTDDTRVAVMLMMMEAGDSDD